MTQWSCRLLAAEQGVGKSTINSIWQGHDLKPHLAKTFKLSRDAVFLEKLTDVVGQRYQRRRHQEFLRCLRRLGRQSPAKTPLHLVMDNYGAPKHPRVRNWLKRHPRFVPHFVPTRNSWLHLVERWFGELTRKRIRRDSFGSVADLQKAIEEFLHAWNANPKPFVWTATVESIVEELSRCRQTLEQIQPGRTVSRKRKAQRKLRK
jgi:hypothetical protein